jgi:sporulation protein YlmC with PRC-barrel domain
MKKMTYVVAVISILSLVLLGSSSFAQSLWNPGFGPGEQMPMCALYQRTSLDLLEANWLIGHDVQSPTGATLGYISDLVIDQANGRIALVVLSNVQHLGAKEVAIPYSSLIRTYPEDFQLSLGSKETEAGFVSGDSRMDPYAYYLAGAPSTSDLYGIPSVIDSAWLSRIYSRYGQVPYWTEEGQKPIAALELYRSSKFIGAALRSSEGEEVAKVHDLVIDSLNGQIIFLSLRNVAGRGDALEAIPFSILSKSEGNTFALNIAREKLAAAPTFNESEDINNPKWAENDYSFFGVQPCWIEEGTQ